MDPIPEEEDDDDDESHSYISDHGPDDDESHECGPGCECDQSSMDSEEREALWEAFWYNIENGPI